MFGWKFLLPVALVFNAPAFAQKDDSSSHYLPTPPVQYPQGVKSYRDVTYSEISGFRPLTLDLYLPPEGGAPKPTVIFIHGGAFLHRTARDGGVFKDFPAVLASVAARGYVVASINYRFSGEVKFPGAVQDAGRAIQWLRTNAAKYNLDPAHVALWGSSAGGQIATLIGTGCTEAALQPPHAPDAKAPQPSTCVQGVIDWYGVIDFEHTASDLGIVPAETAPSIENKYFGCAISKCPPGLVRSASPLAYVDSKDPPFLIQHGTADKSVSPKQAQRLYDALHGAGVPAELVFYPNVSHGFAKVPGGGPDDAINKQALDKVFEFLARYLPSK